MSAARSTKGKGRKGATRRSADARGEVGIPSVIDDLAPTARELLEAARRLLETEGYSSLTLKAIGREAGQNESLIGYHFGSKTGLLAALVDWLVYDIVRGLHARVLRLEEGQDQLHPAMDDARQLVGDVESYRAFYDLMPHLLATREGRLRMAQLYTTYRELEREGAVVRPRAGAFSPGSRRGRHARGAHRRARPAGPHGSGRRGRAAGGRALGGLRAPPASGGARTPRGDGDVTPRREAAR